MVSTAISEWRAIQRTNLTKYDDLITFLQLDLLNSKRVLKKSAFPLNLPIRLAEKIAKNTLDDPILRQFVPLDLEETSVEGFSKDPIDESTFHRSSKLLQKYEGRALLLASACALNCRYCFRRHFPYASAIAGYEEEIKILEQDPTIKEVIFSGGDPLSLSDQLLEKTLFALRDIPHIKRIRIHTRFPIGIPERISPELVNIFMALEDRLTIVFHINHAREIDADVKRAVHLLKPFQLLNQSVLLRGVNDSAQALEALSFRLAEVGITPYYLHHLDRVEGAAHYMVSKDEGLSIIASMRENMPGYLVPRYVVEIPQAKSKTPITCELTS